MFLHSIDYGSFYDNKYAQFIVVDAVGIHIYVRGCFIVKTSTNQLSCIDGEDKRSLLWYIWINSQSNFIDVECVLYMAYSIDHQYQNIVP